MQKALPKSRIWKTEKNQTQWSNYLAWSIAQATVFLFSYSKPLPIFGQSKK